MTAIPTLLVEFSTDDADEPTPTWVDVTADVRSFSTSRGRGDERTRVDAGTATLVLNNRNREWDPTTNSLLRPMNRWRIQAILPDASTEPVYLGYAESYDQQWPATGHDAVTVVSCADEFKVLAQDALPATDPPRDSYAELVLFDEPQGYWRLQDTELLKIEALVGDVQMINGGGSYARAATAIVGDWPVDGTSTPFGARSTTQRLFTVDADLAAGLPVQGPGDAAGLSAFTFETWFMSTEATPAADRIIASGPLSGGSPQWTLQLLTTGRLRGTARNSGGTTHTEDTHFLSANTWYHLAITVDGSLLKVYRNGTAFAGTAWSGVFGTMDAGGFLQLGTTTAVGGTRSYDEPAFYRRALSDARVLAHYTAGRLRGFQSVLDLSGDRIDDILDAVGSIAPRNLQQGSFRILPTYMVGQDPLSEMRRAESVESIDSVLFVAKDGTITFLQWDYRLTAPYDTPQATFTDDGTGLPYTDISVDYSDSFIANEWNVTADGETTETASDATSVSQFGKRTQALNIPLDETGGNAAQIAAAMLAKYKDPIFKITSLTTMLHTTDLSNTVPTLELGDMIEVIRDQETTEPTLYPATTLYPSTSLFPTLGGDPMVQASWIQKIDVDGAPKKPWRVQLGVSPI